MTKPATVLYFGTQLEGTEPQIKVYDDSASTWLEYTIPPGLYFYNHPESQKNIVSVLNVLMAGFVTLSRQNDRQLKFDMTATADDFRLIETGNRDTEKLAYLLGLYDNSGNWLYHIDVNVTDNWITQGTCATWYSESGRMMETSTERGFAAYEAQYSYAQSGKTAGISTGKRNLVQPLTFTFVDADDLRVIDLYGEQTTLGTTEDADWTTSFWNAYNPDLRAAVFYAELTDRSGNTVEGEWYITDPIGPEQCKPSVQGFAGVFDLTIRASFIEVNEQDKFLYFAPSALHTCNVTNNALKAFTSDMSIIIKFYFIDNDAAGTLITMWDIAGNIPFSLRIDNTSTHRLYWWQGTTVGSQYDGVNVTGLTPNTEYILVVTRSGQTGVNNCSVWVNGAQTQWSTTKTPIEADGSVGLMQWADRTSTTNYRCYGYVYHLQLFNRVLTAAEISNANLGLWPATDTSVVTYNFAEKGGMQHLDTSGNGLTLTSTATSWAVIP